MGSMLTWQPAAFSFNVAGDWAGVIAAMPMHEPNDIVDEHGCRTQVKVIEKSQ